MLQRQPYALPTGRFVMNADVLPLTLQFLLIPQSVSEKFVLMTAMPSLKAMKRDVLRTARCFTRKMPARLTGLRELMSKPVMPTDRPWKRTFVIIAIARPAI